jgi:hypothetical protein
VCRPISAEYGTAELQLELDFRFEGIPKLITLQIKFYVTVINGGNILKDTTKVEAFP